MKYIMKSHESNMILIICSTVTDVPVEPNTLLCYEQTKLATFDWYVVYIFFSIYHVNIEHPQFLHVMLMNRVSAALLKLLSKF